MFRNTYTTYYVGPMSSVNKNLFKPKQQLGLINLEVKKDKQDRMPSQADGLCCEISQQYV